MWDSRVVEKIECGKSCLEGENFTWSNNRDSQAWPRIDRFLLSPD